MTRWRRLTWRKGDVLKHKDSGLLFTFPGWHCMLCGRMRMSEIPEKPGCKVVPHAKYYKLHKRKPT